MQSVMTVHSFGGVDDPELYCPRYRLGYGRTSAAPMSSRLAGLSFDVPLIVA